MLSNTSPIFTFTESDYDSSSPKFIATSDFSRNLRFATKVIPLKLSNSNTNHGVITIEIHSSDNIDYGCVSFTHPNGSPASVSTNKDGLYIPADLTLMNVNVFKKDGIRGITIYHVIVNSDQSNTSDILLINIGLGQYKVKEELSSVYITYECPENVYSYNVGMHVYSPYDAINNPKLSTILYSFTQISDWTINTLVYSSSFFSNPALPYYYGYNGKVYKVGGELDRAFGTTTYYRTVKKNAFSKPKTTTITDGPRSYYNSNTDTSLACVVPKMRDVGKIKEIILSTNLTEPNSYRYYLGYDDNVIDDSSRNTFTLYSFSKQFHYPIIGSLHALIKLGSGLVNGYDSTETDWRKILSIKGMSGIMTWKNGMNFAATGAVLGLAVIAVDVISIGAGWSLLASCGCQGAVASILGMNLAPGIGTIISIISLTILLVTLVIKLFKKTTIETKEECKIFLHRYTPSPYILTGERLSDKTNSQYLTGIYCDGIYYYTQDQNGTIISKSQCSGTFYDYFQEGAEIITQTTQSSITPDNPTLVISWEDLIILPYTSGKPEPVCKGVIYYNTLLEIEIPNNCCDLEIFTSKKIIIPAKQEFSCISQLDANNKAKILLDSSYEFAATHGNYSESIPDIYMGILDSKFTNISWVEFGPIKPVVSESATLFFDNRDEKGLIVGKSVYLDPSGCQKALKGYYTGSPYGGTIDGNPSTILTKQPIKTYQVELGKIIRINNETKTNSFYPSYISNWFLTDTSITSLTQTKILMDNSRTFDPTTLENNDKCFQGLIKKSSSDDYSVINDLLLFSNGTYSSAPEGFYLPLIDWINYSPFYYSEPDEIVLNISENCDVKTSRGFYVIGVSKLTNTNTPTHNEVTLSVSVRSGNKSKVYIVTTSPTLSKTLIPYGTFFTSSDIISEITINLIITKSPLNNITYTIGSAYLCPNNSIVVIPCNGKYTQDTNLGKGYYEMTTNIGTLTGITSIDFNSDLLPDRFQIYWNDKLVCDSLFVGDILHSDKRQYYVDEIIKVKSLNRYIYENNGWKPYITPIINVSYDSRDIASNGNRISEISKPTPQLGVDKYYGSNIADGNIKLKFNKTSPTPSTIRIVAISPIGGSNWSINKLSCFTPPNIIPFKYRLKGDGITVSPDNKFGFVFDDTRDSISFSRCNEYKFSLYKTRTASLQIKSSTGGIPVTLRIYKNNIFFDSKTSTTIENEWSLGSILLYSTVSCENITDYYTFNVDYSQPMTFVARVLITTSFDSYNTLGQYLGVGNSYNYITQEIVSITPTIEFLPSFTTTMVVGGYSPYYGYFQGVSGSGSLSNTTINLNIGGSNIKLNSLYYHTETGYIVFTLTNNSTTVSPNWTTLTINDTIYNRTSVISRGYLSVSGYWQWIIRTSNPFGVSVGATRTITLT